VKFSKFSLLIIFCLLTTTQSSLAQNANTILILPFDVQADPKYDYLKPALLDMLFTRLSAPGRILVIGKQEEQMGPFETFTVADAIQIGRQKGADYIVTGSIALQDDTIGTEAEFIGIDAQKALVSFTQKGLQPGDIITHIDNFTAQVNADIFRPGATINEQTSQSEATDDIHQHPEKLAIPETSAQNSSKPTNEKKSRQNLQQFDNR
jgi:TolB-like protein